MRSNAFDDKNDMDQQHRPHLTTFVSCPRLLLYFCIRPTGWFKHKTQNSFRCQCPRRFWELDPEILYTCFVCPCRSLTNGAFSFVCFFRQIFFVLFFWGYLGRKRPYIFGEKKKEKENPIRKRLGKGILNTRAKCQGLTPKNGVDISTFVRLSAKTTAWHRNYLVLVYIRFWALNLTLNWSYSVSSSNFCAKLCTHMPWSIRKHLVQKKNGSFFF